MPSPCSLEILDAGNRLASAQPVEVPRHRVYRSYQNLSSPAFSTLSRAAPASRVARTTSPPSFSSSADRSTGSRGAKWLVVSSSPPR